MEQLFTIRETAKLLTLKESTIYRWVFDGKIKPVRVGSRAVRVPESEILRIREAGEKA
ncbi:helix-turn-helix domain-containing protein [Leptospirillum ferriphilum]|uniref:helix-turn-helix transcriptional regulator n=1 Tax=Leptospirillum ferriphilum TaxID=178606 RepID=UPI0009E96E97